MSGSSGLARWIDRLAWVCIYGGLLAVILGVVSGEVHVIAGWSLGVVGAVVLAVGVALIFVRSRLGDDDSGGR